MSEQLNYTLQFDTVNQFQIKFDAQIAGSCSDVRLHIYLDGSQLEVTEYYGPISGVTTSGWLDFSPVPGGAHTLVLKPEGHMSGQPGDCSHGTLGGWAGTLGVRTNHYP